MKGAIRFLNSLSGRIVIVCSAALLITFSATFYVFERAHERLLFQQVESQARILFKQIVLTRRWIADHGGIFVEKLPWVKKNPFLKEPEITDMTGRRLIKENPAYVTRQLSEYSKKEGLYWFHITSLRLVNPSNKPDTFERKALLRFEKEGLEELSTIEKTGKNRLYRYIAPLYVEPSCLECHRDYRIGDVRGAISVTIPVDNLFSDISRNRLTLAAVALSVSILLLSFLYLSLKSLVIRPITRLRETMEGYQKGEPLDPGKPVTEELAGLYSTFSGLIETISRYHDSLEDEVRKATEELRSTNQKLLEVSRQYRELSARKSDFISSISHELRTPLTSIKGSISYIEQRLRTMNRECVQSCDIEDIISFMEIISSNADRLARMVSETLDLEKIESGKMEIHLELIHLDRLIREVTLEIVPFLEEKKLSLKTNVEENLAVRADEDRISQVLLNLLNNAIQHSPENEEITIEAYMTGDWVAVRIIDRGPGVPAEIQERIFERFYRERKGGTGLGLAISRGIIEAHGGEIGVISSPGNRGSIFYFKIPAYREGGRYASDSDN
jgi:signal transduction histidine kinase